MQKALSILSAGKSLEIVAFIRKAKKSTVNPIVDAMGIPQNLCSYHLLRLASIGILKSKKVGRFVWYSVDEKAFKALKKEFKKL